ncbi:hypothetical protein BTVI_58147 [Pitangus sulphuratus]|nr:hypothetical protein BTVI_58147 [Pitangus sulphuratus]
MRKSDQNVNNRPQRIAPRSQTLQCYYCKGKGHLKRSCPKRQRDFKLLEETERDKGCQGFYFLGMKHHKEPLIKIKLGPQDKEYELLVDTGADRTCITKVSQGCKVSRDTIRVIGAKGEGFPVPLIKQVQIEGEIEDLLLVPEAGYNLSGRDLQVSLGIGVVPEEGEMKVKIMTLKEEDEDKINPSVWASEDQVRKLKIDPIKIEIINPNHPMQYPISQEGRMGLKPIIDKLLTNDTLEFCMSPHNTPILPVKKGDGTFRLVQDLREVNKRTIAWFPVVSNPYTLLSHIPPNYTWVKPNVRNVTMVKNLCMLINCSLGHSFVIYIGFIVELSAVSWFSISASFQAHPVTPLYDDYGAVHQKKRSEIGGTQKWYDDEWPPEHIIATYGPATWAQDGSWGYQTPIYMLNRIIRLQAVMEIVANKTVQTLDLITSQQQNLELQCIKIDLL